MLLRTAIRFLYVLAALVALPAAGRATELPRTPEVLQDATVQPRQPVQLIQQALQQPPAQLGQQPLQAPQAEPIQQALQPAPATPIQASEPAPQPAQPQVAQAKPQPAREQQARNAERPRRTLALASRQTARPPMTGLTRQQRQLLRDRRARVDVPIWTGSISEGPQARYVRRVRSWSDMRFLGIVRQQTDFSCGAAALATVFNAAYGKTTSERQVLVNMMKIADPEVVKQKGFSLLDMKNYVKAIGMQGEGYAVPYDALQQLKVPGIVLMNVKGYKHFVVVRHATKDYVQVADPALGNRTLGRKQFQREWNGVVFVVLAKGYQPNNTLRNPPSPLAARRYVDHYSPIRNAEIADFGIRNLNFRF